MGIKKKQVPGCACCPPEIPPPPPHTCTACDGEFDGITISLSGITDGSGTGSDCCDQINGTYEVNMDAHGSGACSFFVTIAPNFCTPLAGYRLEIQVTISKIDADTTRVQVEVDFITGGLGGTYSLLFQKEFDYPIDCINLSDAITFISESGATSKCNGTPSCVITIVNL